jgi:hypothetical protein
MAGEEYTMKQNWIRITALASWARIKGWREHRDGLYTKPRRYMAQW